jgi:ubiquinone/menaquinone biosynthesis C-methylase UbiE
MAKDWWKTFFNEDYLLFWSARLKHTKKEVNFLIKNLPIKKNDAILDLCCGHGRHSLELASRGYNVTGLDYSKFELELAKKQAKKRHLDVVFCQGDARNFKFAKKFDVIINMFTAFGYGSKADDQKILNYACRHLKKGGRFFIDLMNLIWIFRHFQEKKTERLGKNIYAKMVRSFDFTKNINNETRIIFKKGKKEIYRQACHIYPLPEIIEMMGAAGMKFQKVWGSFDGKPYGLDSKRMIILAKKV